jgi:hypothetical protein
MKKHAIFAALLALVAMAAVPAMASAVTLTAPAGTKLVAGSPLLATSSNLVFTGSNGVELKCTENNFVGEVETNGAPTSTSKINSATFTGTGGGACATNVPGLTANVTTVASSLPWIIHFKTADKWALTHPVFTTTFTMPEGTSVAHCTFTATEVTGTYTTTPNPLVFTVGAGTFTQIEPSSKCEALNGTLTGSASVTSGGNNVIAD